MNKEVNGMTLRNRWLGLTGSLIILVALFAAPTQAEYNIVLKDGSIIRTQGPYEVHGRLVTVRNTKGQLLSLPLSSIDESKTTQANADDAIVIRKGDPLPGEDDGDSSSADQHKPIVVDNANIGDFRKARISSSGTTSEQQAPAKVKKTAGVLKDKSEINQMEDRVKKLRDQINVKVKEANARKGNFAISKKVEREVAELEKQFEAEKNKYYDAVSDYNKALSQGKATAGTSQSGDGAEEERSSSAPVSEPEAAPEPPEPVEDFPEPEVID